MRGQLLSKDKPDEAKGYGDGNGNGGVQVVHLGMSGLSTSYSRFYTSTVCILTLARQKAPRK